MVQIKDNTIEISRGLVRKLFPQLHHRFGDEHEMSHIKKKLKNKQSMDFIVPNNEE